MIDKKKKIQIEIENIIHPGFYESSISDPGYSQFEGDNQELDGFLSENDITLEYDVNEYMQECSNELNDLLIEKINEEVKEHLNIEDLIIKKVSEELISPRYYNYGTDRSFVIVEVYEYKYKRFLNGMFSKYYDVLKKAIIDRHSSYSGFVSFYSNDISDWRVKSEFDCNELGTMFSVLIDRHEDDIFYDVIERSQEVFYEVDSWYESWNDGAIYYYYDLYEVIVDHKVPVHNSFI